MSRSSVRVGKRRWHRVTGSRLRCACAERAAYYRWFLVRSISAALGRWRDIARWYGIHIDIEQQHRAQQSLVQAQDDLTRLLRTLSMAEMAASIAHELNQPLTAVVTHAYACREWLQQ